MSEFKQVTVSKAANVYFDGKVTSRKITFSDGSFKTLGIMMPGDYKFATNEQELMEITAGECEIYLPVPVIGKVSAPVSLLKCQQIARLKLKRKP